MGVRVSRQPSPYARIDDEARIGDRMGMQQEQACRLWGTHLTPATR
jgi:hypothetical protein